MIQSYRDLIVWQKSMKLVKVVYDLLKKMPKEEMFALSDQMRRAAISIPSNIAEGYGRNTPVEYLRFLRIARGSIYELETQIDICVMMGYFTKEEAVSAVQCSREVGKMLNAMLSKIV